MRINKTVMISAVLFIIILIVSVITRQQFFDKQGMEVSKEIFLAIKKLAPLGGDGTKKYFYDSGELKEVVHWKDYSVQSIEYYALDGTKIYTSRVRNGRSLNITLTASGKISEVYETRNYVREGAQLFLKDGQLVRVFIVESDEIVSSFELSGKRAGKGVRNECAIVSLPKT